MLLEHVYVFTPHAPIFTGFTLQRPIDECALLFIVRDPKVEKVQGRIAGRRVVCPGDVDVRLCRVALRPGHDHHQAQEQAQPC